MNEQQVRDRVSAAADTIDCSPVPLTAIRRTGRTIVRRRTRVRVVGYAAAIVGVVGLAVAVPMVGPRNNEPTSATEAPSTGVGDCPPGVSQSDADCGRIPGVGEESYEPTYGELSAAGPAQRRAVEDSRVTEAEYRAGFERYRACLADQGFLLGVADGTGPIISYTVPGAAVDSGVDQPCYERHFRLVDIMWQSKHATRRGRGKRFAATTSLRVFRRIALRSVTRSESDRTTVGGRLFSTYLS